MAAGFEARIALVVRRAARAVDRTASPPVVVESLPATAEPEPDAPDRVLAFSIGLTDDESDFLWSVIAHAVEPAVVASARTLFGNDSRHGVSLAQHIAWAELPVDRSRALLELLDPRHRLRTSGILHPVGDTADVSTPWATTPRVCNHMRGDTDVDASVAAIGGLVIAGNGRYSADQMRVVQTLQDWLTATSPATIIVDGSTGTGRRTAIAVAASRKVVAVDFSRVPVRRVHAMLAALRCEAVLLDAIPVMANLDDLWSRLPLDAELKSELVVALDAIDGPLVITTSRPIVELAAVRRMIVRARWPLPDAATRRELWIDALGDPPPAAQLDLIAQRYALGAGGIAAAARSAGHHGLSLGVGPPSLEALVAGVQDNIAERLGELARRVDINQSWNELVLTPDTLDDVRALIDRVRHSHTVLNGWGFRKKLPRGTGVAALFSGPPGTGKTMVAGLLARELQLELYQVDLSRIISKWVGETEKQLALVFEAAEHGHALLLFDEADSLFAKRSPDVKSAVDRYANLEVNYLLQRVESFGGVVILTTNLDTSIDPALRRRLASHIVFGPPELEERIKLWRGMLDTGAPVDERINYRQLAEEFRLMTGANIRNAVLTAAFLVVGEGVTISMNHLMRAGRSEYRAMGHMLAKDPSRL